MPDYRRRPQFFVVAGRHLAKPVGAPGLLYRTRRLWGDHGITNHVWRKTVASSLRANRCDPVVRDQILGWSDGSIFTRHYSAVSPQELQSAILLLYRDDPV